MYLFGLGNPGSRYELTRHNAGAIMVDMLARQAGQTLGQRQFEAHFAKGELFGRPLVFVRPSHFMNLSGQALQPWIHYFRIEPHQLVVLHDDIDMESGAVKLRKGGGHGGHNGIRNILELTGLSDFYRIKIGVGKPQAENTEERRKKLTSWVLEPFSQVELDRLQGQVLDEVMLRLKDILQQQTR